MKYLVVLIGFLFLSHLSAQSSMIGLDYQMTAPMGSFGEFIKDYSGKGVRGQYSYLFNDKIAIGMDASWHLYEKNEAEASLFIGDQQVLGPSFKSVDFTAINLTSTYFLNLPIALKPSLSFGMGLAYVDLQQQIGPFQKHYYNWQFSLHGELAFNILIAHSAWGIRFAGRYDYLEFNNDFFSEMHQFSLLGGVFYCPQWKIKGVD